MGILIGLFVACSNVDDECGKWRFDSDQGEMVWHTDGLFCKFKEQK